MKQCRFGLVAVVMAISVGSGGSAVLAQDGRAPIWTGAYIGAHIGGAFGKFSGLGSDVSISGAVGGLHAGYNWQTGAMVFGVETDADFNGAEKSEKSPSGQVEVKLSNPFLGSVRGRVGLASGAALLYATGGVAFSTQEITASAAAISLGIKDETRTGYVLGFGMDYAISTRVSAGVEALQYSFKDVFQASAGNGLKYDVSSIRSGMSYRF